MKTALLVMLTVTAITFGFAIPAQADETLSTPLVPSSTFILCAITNVGDKRVAVTATVFDFSGADVSRPPDPTICPSLTLDPNKTCIIFAELSGNPPTVGFCKFTSSGSNVRAEGIGDVVVPATK